MEAGSEIVGSLSRCNRKLVLLRVYFSVGLPKPLRVLPLKGSLAVWETCWLRDMHGPSLGYFLLFVRPEQGF